MTLIPTSFRRPNLVPAGEAHESVRFAIFSHDQSITDLNQAIAAQANQISALKSSSTATTSGTSTTTNTSTENVTNVTVAGGQVNNQSGNAVYTSTPSDNGALIVLGDTVPVAVTLNNSVTTPWYAFFYNSGTSNVTVTPQQGLVNGSASEIITPGLFSIIFFDGFNYFAAALPIVPLTFAPVAHEFLTGYDDSSGVFSAAQPSFTDISGIAATNQIGTGTPTAGEYVDGGTGAWTALPGGLSVTITTAALTIGGTQGSQTFVDGQLKAQVQAT